MASVRGKRRAGSPRTYKPRISLAALIPVVAVFVVVGLMLFSRWMTDRELELARADLLGQMSAHRASLPAQSSGFLRAARSCVSRLAGPWEGDLVAEPLSRPGELQARLARPALYVRGDQLKLENPDRLLEAAASSVKDSVLLCLADPPESRTEKVVLQKIRGANFAAALPSVRRFYDAEAGLLLLEPPWEAKLRAARELKAVNALRGEWMRAPLEDGRQAAVAESLIVVVDEAPEVEPNADPGDKRRADERGHWIRVGIVDLRSQAVLLRLRKAEDPSAYAPATRAAHARAITGCLIAMDVHDVAGKGQ